MTNNFTIRPFKKCTAYSHSLSWEVPWPGPSLCDHHTIKFHNNQDNTPVLFRIMIGSRSGPSVVSLSGSLWFSCALLRY